ncbi:phage baseplate assembly protein V [Streptomyces sp. NBC_01275]|uniref:phage baseplate assembly protein V n=1 Tax=Streptomyces sp. NBC_01275 TaxID=2903807 RepID=UPI0022515CE4|nr:phage baseplate assembly protein V [Streptomyces sp. NBC_01275]MCX4759752.1 phage baseplate assembly protein V [Streptomyces sp. NBC_01275]
MTEPAYYAPRFEVRVQGLTLAADIAEQVLSLTVETDLDLAGSFALVLRNSDNALLDSALLDLGRTVEIHLGYGAELHPAFLGEITAVEPSFPQDGPPTVRVRGYDRSYRMRHSRPEPTSYPLMNDGLIAARIALENGLVPVVDPTPGLPQTIPRAESDMAFLKARAQKYCFDVYVEWDRLHFHFPRPRTAAHILEWGRNLSSFSPRISGAGLAGLQLIRGYDQELAQAVHSVAFAADFDVATLTERLGSAALDLLASFVREGDRTHSADDPLTAATLARSLLTQLLEGLYEGDGSCIGLPRLTAGAYVEIRGVGKRFSGTYRLRKVTHRIDAGGFTTDFSITQRGHTSLLGLLRKQLTEEPAPDRPERFHGVVVGVVEDNDELRSVPPQVPLGRVKVSFPGLSSTLTSGWAPCARPMTGDGFGFYALPEPGDQVLVAFEHGDLARPYVLGGLWSAQQTPPVVNADGGNSIRVIKSRAGHSITFDDTLDTGELVIRDGSGSTITLDARTGAITIEAGTDLTIKAGGAISLEAAGGATKISMNATEVDVT